MFETPSFRAQLQEIVSSELGRTKITRFETEIPTFLQALATDNEPVLMEREIKKAVGTRRGIPDALQSARELVRDAIVSAVVARRDTLEVADVRKAYEAKFCKVWPFCRS